MSGKQKMAFGSFSICCLLLVTLMASCKAKTITVPVTIVATVTATPTAVAAATVSTVPTTTPKLNSAAINLTVVPPGDYAANVVPLYLTGNMVLHLSWKVEGGPFCMTVTTPSGLVVPVTADGVQTSGTAGPLDYSGGIQFCISDGAYSGWDAGYYDFTPNLIKGDAAVKITLNYYFDTKPASSSTSSNKPATS